MVETASADRVVVYALFDADGEVRAYVRRALAGLKRHARRVLVVANGGLSTAGRAVLDEIGAELLERENEGFDIEAYRAGLRRLGDDADGADEVLLANDTWFGPADSFDDLFARMSAVDADVWGVTEHRAASPHPLTKTGSVQRHLQSYWMLARRRALVSAAWRGWWRTLPPIRSYDDAVLQHESVFTAHLEAAGLRVVAAFPADRYTSDNPSLWEAERLIRDGCPVLKRRALFYWPPALDAHGSIGRWTMDAFAARGHPVHEILDGLVRIVEPRVLATDTAALTVLPEPSARGAGRTLRVLAVLHVHYVDMLPLLLDAIAPLPAGHDLVVTTSDVERAAQLRDALRAQGRAAEVRVVASNDGRDLSAFYIGVRDLLASERYDLVVKLHSKRTPQDGFAIGRHFLHQQLSNLVGTVEQVDGVLAHFERDPGLGIVFPPMMHIGYPTLGHGWWANRPGVAALCARLGIRVPLDQASPLAPYGSMFVARPEALRLLWDHPWRYEDFGGAEAYRDGGPAHVLERMPVYAAAQLGYHARTVMSARYLAVSHAALDFDLDRLTALLPGTTEEAVDLVLRAGPLGDLRAGDALRMHLRLHHPGLGARLRRALWPLVRFRRRLRARRSPS